MGFGKLQNILKLKKIEQPVDVGVKDNVYPKAVFQKNTFSHQ